MQTFLIDKNAFTGINKDILIEFIKSHGLVLPETLFYECYTDDKLSEKNHCIDIERLLKAGACVSYQLEQIIQDEAKNSSPCQSIIDHYWTERLRANLLQKKDRFNLQAIMQKKTDRSKLGINIKKYAETIWDKLGKEYLAEIRRLNDKRANRIRRWMDEVNRSDIHTLSVKFFNKYSPLPERFSLSDEWVSWHYAKLLYVLALEYSFKAASGLPNDENAERFSMDIQYLTFLAKCDGLITGDKWLRDLAEIAFPEKAKNIYPNINEAMVTQ